MQDAAEGIRVHRCLPEYGCDLSDSVTAEIPDLEVFRCGLQFSLALKVLCAVFEDLRGSSLSQKCAKGLCLCLGSLRRIGTITQIHKGLNYLFPGFIDIF